MHQPVLDELLAFWSQNGFWVELDATNVKFLVAKRHDLTFIAHASDLETLWQSSSIDNPRMIAADEDITGDATEDIIALLHAINVEIYDMSWCLHAMEDIGEIDQRTFASISSASCGLSLSSALTASRP